MSYEEALADLKEQFWPNKLVDTQDAADALGRSRERALSAYRETEAVDERRQ